MASFTTLESLYQMTTPADLSGKLRSGFGVDSLKDPNVVDSLMQVLLESTATGARDFKSIRRLLNNLVAKSDVSSRAQLQDLITVLSTEGTISALANETLVGRPKRAGENAVVVKNLKEVIGSKFLIDDDKQSASIIISRSPFIHPTKIATNKIDLFLNGMPSIFASQMSPYMDVEFQVIRPSGEAIQSPGLLKFLLGAAPKSGLSVQDKALLDSHELIVGGEEHTFAGMEMFTSPQTLVNMNSLNSLGSRYADVLDPFRPFASLESVNIVVTPAVGTYTYKSATMTLKIHDRSRLLEFSELIRPKGYKDVVIWLTYGWLAPKDSQNAYAQYINNNMLRREAYGIVNSSFTFDKGQVTLTLKLYTKGVQQAQTALISDSPSLVKLDELRKIGEEIATYRKRTLKDPPEGFGGDIRIYQLLDSAQSGEFPDFSSQDVNKLIEKLRTTMSKTSGFDKTAMDGLITALKKFYKGNKQGKFDYQTQIQNTVTKLVQDKFNECLTGPDPFLPSQAQADKGLVDPELVREVAKYNTEAGSKSIKEFQHKLVSVGKLFSVFIVPAILAQRTVNEVQCFFYAFNEQTGPISLHSVAEFPVDMSVFMDQYRDMVIARGGERITIEEFMQLLINAQILDNRAVGYGLRSVYEPYDHKDHDPKIKENQEQEFESRIAAQTAKYGGFKLPSIEMYIEVMHKNESDSLQSQVDLLSQLETSAKTTQTTAAADVSAANKAYTIMRIHVYDKQLNPYKELGSMFRHGADGLSFSEVNKSKIKSEIVEKRFNQKNLSQQEFVNKFIQPKTSQFQDGYKLVGRGSADLVRDYLLNTVPKLDLGVNGTTILSADLSSKIDPLLSTVNMLRNVRIKNTVAPNGAGDYGLPLRVVPAQLSLTTLGCPLFSMAQTFFVDANTRTSIDNLYLVTGISHNFTQGKFESQITLGYSDAYGRFTGAPNLIQLYEELVPPE